MKYIIHELFHLQKIIYYTDKEILISIFFRYIFYCLTWEIILYVIRFVMIDPWGIQSFYELVMIFIQ